ncbi:MAG TPA: AI-2E family transporter [Candidatus Nanoarchaeia archaeon]|nr:AI-2E family transporter [Candidatus Nanoarchaeia archaeon]
MTEDIHKKIGYIAALAILFYISYIIIKPFISAILASFFLALLFYPLHIKLQKYVKKPAISAFIITILILLIIVIPLIFIAEVIIKESMLLYNTLDLTIIKTSVDNYISSYENIGKFIPSAIEKGLNYIISVASNFLVSIPQKIFALIIILYSTFYLISGGEEIRKTIKSFLPFKNKEHLIQNVSSTTFSIIYGIFLIALIEGVITVIGFSVLGIHSPWVWGLIIAFLGLIPFIGPAIIWIPFFIYKLAEQEIFIAIGLLVIGIILSFIDTFTRQTVIYKKTKLHPVIILIGLLGGAKMIGIVGLLVGPIILSTVIILLETHFKDET